MSQLQEYLSSKKLGTAHRLRSSIKETPEKDEAEASTSHDALASSSMDISDSLEGRRCEQVSTLEEAKEVVDTSNHVLNVVVLPPTAGDSGSDDTDQEYLPDDPEDEFDPAGELEVEQEVRVEEFATTKLSGKEKRALPRWKKTEDLDMIFPFEQLQRNENLQQLASLTPLEVWFKVFTDEMIDHITFQSNLYAHRECNNRAFTVSPQEIRQFIGVILLSGYNCQPEAKYYWSTQPDMGAQGAISCMSRNRFMEIKKYLHLADNQKLVKGDKMSKVTPLYKLLNSSLVKHGMFHEKLSVDESIVPYFGRHAAKMFLKGKPIRFGYKVWMLCGNDGYPYHMTIYQGKEIHAPKRLRSSIKETPEKDEAEASTSHDALASSSMDISDSLEGRRCEQVSTLEEAKEFVDTSNHVLNVVVLPPTAGDSGSDDTDQEYLPDDPEDEFDPAGELEVEQEVRVEEFATTKLSGKEKRALPRWKKTEDLDMIFPFEQLQRNENLQQIASLTPLEVWFKVITDEMIDHITFQSNLYAHRECNNRAFTVSPQEIQQFIGVIVLSRYNCQPEAKNYWSTQPDMGAQCAISCMARNRFMEIKKYLHLADNQKLVKGDKMSKVTPLYKLLNSILVKHGMFHEKLSVDESIVTYYGLHAAKMFLKGKPIRDVDLGMCHQDLQLLNMHQESSGNRLLGYRVVSKVENRYVVLPSQGALQPKKDITINIICHPFPFRSESPPVDTLIIEWVDAFESETDFNEDWFVMGGIVRKKVLSVKFNP
ncbi:PiggyBac transposable element-derived protein 3 [Trichinella patagoniensis]|uniref:PiggyBac transposable element-derived protein 3 n=1 Tax=Trichinella patagoniensis TaxID=990121 RepID=A0A0V0Z5B4_9BILA|nr:PiggyBac transposable element-derived protein 3 [Trichinella patagoniensis]